MSRVAIDIYFAQAFSRMINVENDNILSTLSEVEEINAIEQLEEVTASLGWKVHIDN